MASYQCYFGKVKYFIVFILLTTKVHISKGFTSCETPDAWQSGESSELQENVFDNDYFRTNSKQMWENGQVAYVLHDTLTDENKQEVFKAFAEYHTKTCIIFKPKQISDSDYVRIEVNNEVCGHAKVCRQGGYQFARFGKHCRNMNTMVHELGHSLCLYHEHQRKDRDNYLNFGYCQRDEIDSIIPNAIPLGLYDYQSVMHYQCGLGCKVGWAIDKEVKGCGVDVTPGLSVLDVDNLNSLYNCQGCRRHRWRTVQQLTQTDMANLNSFGYQNQQGLPLYRCRTICKGQIVIGQGIFGQGGFHCIILHYNKILVVQNNVEVLTIPGGLNQNCFTYSLKSRYEAKLSEPVVAAAKNSNTKEQVYIAYGYIRNWNGVYEASIGEVSTINSFPNGVHLVFGSDVINTMEYKVLTCSCAAISIPNPSVSGSFSHIFPQLNNIWSENQLLETTETWDDNNNEFGALESAQDKLFFSKSEENVLDNFGENSLWSSNDDKTKEDLVGNQLSDNLGELEGNSISTWWPGSYSMDDSNELSKFGNRISENRDDSNERDDQ